MRPLIRTIKNGLFALAALWAILPAACGSSSSSSSGNGSPGPGPGPAPVAQGSTVVPAHAFLPVTFTTTGSGSFNVDLGLTTNIVFQGIVTSACTTAATRSSGCRTLSYTESASTDSSKTLNATGVTPGSYAMILGNVGGNSQAVSYTVTLAP